MKNIDELTSRFKELNAIYLAEQKRKDDIRMSQKYRELNDKIEVLTIYRDALISESPETLMQLADYDDAKKELSDAFIAKGMTSYMGVQAKTRVNKEVALGELMHVLGGDVDGFCALAKVTQKALEEYAKGQPQEYKDALKACIKERGITITDLKFDNE